MTRLGAGEIRPVLSRYAAIPLHLSLVVCAAAFVSGCSMPIAMPLSKQSAAEPELITGSVSTPVDDAGVAERVGSSAWLALKSALVSAAERGEDGEAFAWKSPATGADLPVEGTVTAVDAFFDAGGVVCRRLDITATAYRRSDAFRAEACRRDGGGWRVRPLTDGS